MTPTERRAAPAGVGSDDVINIRTRATHTRRQEERQAKRQRERLSTPAVSTVRRRADPRRCSLSVNTVAETGISVAAARGQTGNELSSVSVSE